MKAIEKGMVMFIMAFVSSLAMAQHEEQKEIKKIEPVKVNAMVVSKKTPHQRKAKKLMRVEQIQKAEREEKE